MIKECRRCHAGKPLADFHREAASQDGRCRWCKICVAEVGKKRKATATYRFGYYRENARKRGIEFTLTIEDFRYFWAQPCVYCGEPIEGIGLDRVDNEVGYVVDNVLPCCARCNAMKSDQGLLAFIERCERIASRLYLGVDTEPWANAAIARREA